MAGRGTPHRAFRVPEDLYRAALDKAGRRGESLSAVVRQALEEYIADDEGDAED